jgi:hypothetical protein
VEPEETDLGGFDDLDAPSGDAQPEYVTRDQFDEMRHQHLQMAHVLANYLQGGFEQEPQEPREITMPSMRYNPETGMLDPVPAEPEPVDPEEIARMRAEELINERLGPVLPVLDVVQKEISERQINSAFDRLKSDQNLNFDNKGAEMFANAFISSQPPGSVSFAQAVQVGAAMAIEYEQRIREQRDTDEQARFDALANGRTAPAGNGAGAARLETVPTGADAYEQVQRDFFAGRRAAAGRAG